MIIVMSEKRMRGLARRLQKILDSLGVDFRYTKCLEIAAQLTGFDDWYSYLRRDPDAPLSLLDEELSEAEFEARDAFQMAVLESAGLSTVARELLDRANPAGSWGAQHLEEAVS